MATKTAGQRIREAYLAKSYNRNTFAKAVDVSYTTVTSWEYPTDDERYKEPGRDNLEAAASVLGTSVDELLGRTLTVAIEANRFVEEWLASPEAAAVTEDEKRQLRATQWGGTPMSHGVVREAWRAYRDPPAPTRTPPDPRKGRVRLATKS